jgi:hypothetical protein
MSAKGETCTHVLASIGILLVLLSVVIGVYESAHASSESDGLTAREGRTPEDLPSDWPETRRIIQADLPLETTIKMVVQVLEKESIEVSLSRLDEYQMYMFWVNYDGTVFGDTQFPLNPMVGEDDVFHIVTNRRFIRLVDRLAAVPRNDASNMIARELTAAHRLYKRLWEEQMLSSEDLKKERYRTPDKPSHGLEVLRQDGRPTLVAVRLKVLALLMLAGNLQLDQLRPLITQIIDEALTQRDEFQTNPIYRKGPVAFMLTKGGLYQRQVLATAALGTAAQLSQQEDICKTSGAELKRVNLIGHLRASARWPQYTQDLPEDIEVVIRRVGPISDSQFDSIIAKTRATQVGTVLNRGLTPEAPSF